MSICLALLLALLPQSVLAQEGGPNRAGLIVVHGDGRVLTRCVTFTEERISGVALLQRSGLAVDANTGPMGSAVCTINDEGCPANDCFCKCKSTPCTYWNYFYRNADGSWAYSGMGAVARTLGNGDVDGWVWGDGSAPPPALAFDAICSADPAAAAPSSTSPTVTPTSTPLPPETPIPTPTSPPASVTPVPATSTVAPTPTALSPTSAPPSSPTPAPTTSSPSPSPSISTSISTSTPTAAATLSLTPSPTHPLTYSLSFPVVSSPATPVRRVSASSPLREYIPFAIILISIAGLALLKRKRE